MRKLVIVALCGALAGCQIAAQAPSTASGKPEVTIKAPTAAIKARLLSLAMDRRFNVTKDTDYLLQVEKPTDNPGAAILLGRSMTALQQSESSSRLRRWAIPFA
jgi:hypothetical protein